MWRGPEDVVRPQQRMKLDVLVVLVCNPSRSSRPSSAKSVNLRTAWDTLDLITLKKIQRKPIGPQYTNIL